MMEEKMSGQELNWIASGLGYKINIYIIIICK